VTATRCPRDERGNCNEDHCTTCRTWHLEDGERQTCIRCLGATRRAIRDILDYAPMLPSQAINGQNPEPHRELKIPGGDALVLMLGGSNHATGIRGRTRLGQRPDPGPATYSYPSDPNPPANLLMTWEDDWRHVLHMLPAQNGDLGTVAEFLSDKLGWAAQHHPAFPQFSDEVRKAARHLEQILHAGIRDEIGVNCIRCTDPPRLRAHFTDPDSAWTELDRLYQAGDTSTDQGGRRDYWICPQCHEVYSPQDYLMATGDEMANDPALA
jgi:hypothetical protein